MRDGAWDRAPFLQAARALDFEHDELVMLDEVTATRSASAWRR
jgi:hypothetical protein